MNINTDLQLTEVKQSMPLRPNNAGTDTRPGTSSILTYRNVTIGHHQAREPYKSSNAKISQPITQQWGNDVTIGSQGGSTVFSPVSYTSTSSFGASPFGTTTWNTNLRDYQFSRSGKNVHILTHQTTYRSSRNTLSLPHLVPTNSRPCTAQAVRPCRHVHRK